MTDCIAPHLPPPQPNCTRLDWLPPRNESRCRVLAWTCHCAAIYYELCAAGGQTYLKRTRTRSAKANESHRMPTREGWATWQALLCGLVR